MNRTNSFDEYLSEIGSIDKESIEKRNNRLLRFFQAIYGPKSVMIIGDPNKPAVILLGENYSASVLSCYVHNFTLIFTDSPSQGDHIHSITLTEKACRNPDSEEIMNVIHNSKHRHVYRVKMKDRNLFLSGYNFIDRTKEETKYPVFSRFGMKIYFNKETAERVAEQFEEYNLEVI